MTKMSAALIIIFVVAVALFAAFQLEANPPSYAELNIPKLLAAISAVENTPQTKIGPAGERSEYQLTREVWFTYNRLPFEYASRDDDKGHFLAYATACHHIEWIRDRLHMLNYRDDPYHVALIWKAGFNRCRDHKARFVDTEYAKRVSNIYHDE